MAMTDEEAHRVLAGLLADPPMRRAALAAMAALRAVADLGACEGGKSGVGGGDTGWKPVPRDAGATVGGLEGPTSWDSGSMGAKGAQT